jgi:hypothetical protein
MKFGKLSLDMKRRRVYDEEGNQLTREDLAQVMREFEEESEGDEEETYHPYQSDPKGNLNDPHAYRNEDGRQHNIRSSRALDEPEPFSGRPRPGGSMDPDDPSLMRQEYTPQVPWTQDMRETQDRGRHSADRRETDDRKFTKDMVDKLTSRIGVL